MSSLPGAADNRSRPRRPGPWGTDRAAERAYGYPPPRRDTIAELEARMEALEERIEEVFWHLSSAIEASETPCVP